MEERYVWHTGEGVQIVTESQAISNALDQEKRTGRKDNRYF